MRLIGTKTIAEYMQRDPMTIRRWYHNREITGVPIYKVGNTYEADTEDLERWRKGEKFTHRT